MKRKAESSLTPQIFNQLLQKEKEEQQCHQTQEIQASKSLETAQKIDLAPQPKRRLFQISMKNFLIEKAPF